MIEILDPRRVKVSYPYLTNKSGWSYVLDYNWTITRCMLHRGASILDVGCGKSQLGKHIAQMLKAEYIGIDREAGNDFATYQTDKRFDIIMWVSSLEHNTMEDMRALYLRSMDYLKPGGVFLATVPIAPVTGWFEPSVNTNLSPTDILTVFDEAKLNGVYSEVHKAYRGNMGIMQRYAARYGHWDDNDPVFLVAGVEKIRDDANN